MKKGDEMSDTCVYHKNKVRICEHPATNLLAIARDGYPISTRPGFGKGEFCQSHAEQVAQALEARWLAAKNQPRFADGKQKWCAVC